MDRQRLFVVLGSIVIGGVICYYLYKHRFWVGYRLYTTKWGTKLVHYLHLRKAREQYSTLHDGGGNSNRETIVKRKIVDCYSSDTVVVVQLPILHDNFAYIICDKLSKEAAIVDPADAELVLDEVRRRGWKVTMILSTHKHHDHAGANDDVMAALLLETNEGNRDGKETVAVKSFGSIHDSPLTTNIFVDDGDDIILGNNNNNNNTCIKVLHTPGHTRGSLVYLLQSKDEEKWPSVAFTGDTLFVAGCGRLFEGTANVMFKSFMKFKSMNSSTLLCCGHAYEISNLSFALSLLQEAIDDNGDNLNKNNNTIINNSIRFIKAEIEKANKLDDQGLSLVPTTIEYELKVNPFMNAKDAEEFANVRKRRDQW